MARHTTGTLIVGQRSVSLDGNVLDAVILLTNDRTRLNTMAHGSIEVTFSPIDIKLLPREKIADERRGTLELK